ncbi:hypothetical protein IFT66_08115 [Rhizobium sp. CFBP 13726]|jgi:hypothetical protein|uniref:hypothetical protein n=1 Tax=Rhizobium sp. CFBP 13726 TaxID=2775296 RepID=UPI0013B0454C|nr:hypothetical protein [Rhizobium sp. CFBP 13726]MBD8651040.1 hypothetical protein [Rhizobium sp. CFBP 13726]
MSTHNCFASVPEAFLKISPVETDASRLPAELACRIAPVSIVCGCGTHAHA